MSAASPRIALVTGASAGIGAAVARALAERGFALALGARRADRLGEVASSLGAAGARVFTHALDVGESASVQDFFDAMEKQLGIADVVINNAGVSFPALLHEARPEDLEQEIATNLLGPMLVARRAIPPLLKRRSGDLVFVSSDVVRAPRTFQSAYNATKAGVEALVRTLSMELEGTGVRCSAIRVGPTAPTDFGRDWEPELLRRVMTSWRRFALLRHMNFMKPEVVAAAVVHAVEAPAGSRLEIIEVQPEAPAES